MKLIKKTDEYIVYLKRSGRYGVKNTDHEWINGISKTRILLAEGLIETTLPPEPDVDAGEAADDTEVAAAPDIAVAEEDSSIDDAPGSIDSEAEESEIEEAANARRGIVWRDRGRRLCIRFVRGMLIPLKKNAANEEEEVTRKIQRHPETSTASDSSDDVANADTTDEEEPEAIEDAEGKEP